MQTTRYCWCRIQRAQHLTLNIMTIFMHICRIVRYVFFNGKDFRDPKLKGKENHKRKSNAHNPVQYLWITSAISICFSEIQKTLTPKITKVGIFSFLTLPSNSGYPRISQNSVKYFWLSLSHPLKASGYISVLFPIITTSVRFSQSLNAS